MGPTEAQSTGSTSRLAPFTGPALLVLLVVLFGLVGAVCGGFALIASLLAG